MEGAEGPLLEDTRRRRETQLVGHIMRARKTVLRGQG